MHALRIRKLGLSAATEHSVAAELWSELVGEVTPVEVGSGGQKGLLEQCCMDWTRFWRALVDVAAHPAMRPTPGTSGVATWPSAALDLLRAASYDASTLQSHEVQWMAWLTRWQSHVDINGGAEAMASASPRYVPLGYCT